VSRKNVRQRKCSGGVFDRVGAVTLMQVFSNSTWTLDSRRTRVGGTIQSEKKKGGDHR